MSTATYHGDVEGTGKTRENVLADGGVSTDEVRDPLGLDSLSERRSNIWNVSWYSRRCPPCIHRCSLSASMCS